eukprot:80746_1
MSDHLKQQYQLEGKKPDPQIENRVLKENVYKILILGSSGTGKTTLFKQLRQIHGTGFSKTYRLTFVDYIHEQIIYQMQLALECVKLLEEKKMMNEAGDDEKITDNFNPYTSLSDEAQKAAYVIENISHPELNDEITNAIVCLWKEEVIRNIYEKRATMKIEDSSAYFWDKVHEMNHESYIPNMKDIMLVRHRETGAVHQKLTIGKKSKNIININLFTVGGQRSERKKWNYYFQNVTAVIYVASLNSFDSVMFEDESCNMMTDSLELFDQICNNSCFEETDMILFLNKMDLFAEKIQTVPITVCPYFEDYNGDMTSCDETAHYIKNCFICQNKSSDENKPVYTHLTIATDQSNTERVFNDVLWIMIEATPMTLR